MHTLQLTVGLLPHYSRLQLIIDNNHHYSITEFSQSNYAPTTDRVQNIARSESIAVVESMQLRTPHEVEKEIRNLDADIRVISRFNPHSQWFVQIIFTSFPLFHQFHQSAYQITTNLNIKVQVEISKDPFNKFLFVLVCLDEISK